MDETVKQILKRPIHLADQLIKASYRKQECGQLKFMTEKLAELLLQAMTESSRLHEHPTRRIILETEQVLFKALSLVNSRVNALLKFVFPTIRAAAFCKVSFCLHNSIVNVSWLLRIFNVTIDRDGILEQIAILLTSSLEDQSEAAACLVSLASNDDRYCRLIMEEGGVSPLLNLLKEGNIEGQAVAARAIGLLGRDPLCVEHMILVLDIL